MTIKLPVRVQIPDGSDNRKIKWLELHEGDGGFYLFQIVENTNSVKRDSLHPSLEEIIIDGREIWKIDLDLWQPIA